MTQPTIKDVIEALRHVGCASGLDVRHALANRIEAEGIAPDIDLNGCSTHPKARHGFARQASHSEGEHVCECAGFDPYDAGYQDGLSAAWNADGVLLPDGFRLVPEKCEAKWSYKMRKDGTIFFVTPTAAFDSHASVGEAELIVRSVNAMLAAAEIGRTK